jgi:hypothetical protein
MIQSFFSVLLASFVMSLTAVFRCGAVALSGSLMFLRRGSMRVNYVVFFVHCNIPLSMPGDPGSSLKLMHAGGLLV